MTLPPGPTAVIATQAVFLFLSYVFVSARLYSRNSIVKKVDWDDFFLVLTLAFYTCFASFIITVGSVHEYQYAINPLNPLATIDGLNRGQHFFFLSEIFYILSAGTLRLSVGLLLLRIAHTKAQKITIWVVITLMLITSTIFLFIVIFQCSPVSFFWNFSPLAIGTCGNHEVLAKVGYAHMAVSFVADWTLGLLPIWLLWKVQMGWRRKAGIAVLLGFGLLCGVAAMARIPFIKQLLDTSNFQADWVGLALCSVIEPGLGLIAASLAAFRPLFGTKGFQSLGSKLSGGNLWSKRSGSKQDTGGSGVQESKLEEGSGGIHVVRTVDVESRKVNGTTDGHVGGVSGANSTTSESH